MIPTSSDLKGLKVDHSLDVRGAVSPDGYRKAVTQLGAMKEHEVLELHIDEGEALDAIPFALRAEGHEILVSEPATGGVRLLVRKRTLVT
ncbi:MAG: sulfurtransferase TusA family protein [Candidatus Omnitrophica bacterium]|nr:sulfurtransferase TusA family protein [Candidatus Omnitrophota bacterium]